MTPPYRTPPGLYLAPRYVLPRQYSRPLNDDESYRSPITPGFIVQNVLVGLTVSFVAISLGAAFGLLSGRGAFAGMISAGIIAVVTALFGGTRVQCSGPTAPMTAVTVAIMGFATAGLVDRLPNAAPDQFVNFVLILAGVILLGAAALRLGRFITLVPRVVISGFMNGIAILIWVDQATKLFGFGGQVAFGGSQNANIGLALATFVVALALPALTQRLVPRAARFLSPTLLAIVFATIAAQGLTLDAERIHVAGIASVSAFVTMIAEQFPSDADIGWLWVALPFSIQLAGLCYLDTLLTSLVVDRLTRETTHQDKELAAQGVANGLVALVGGIPGAQATIRSVLMIKEGATLRLAGVMVGVFVLVEMVLLKDLVSLVPQAVFAGILFKVGYDVFDWRPLGLYLRGLQRGYDARPGFSVSHPEVFFITGTSLVTVFWDLNVAVISFALLFYAVRRFIVVPDLDDPEETLGVRRED